jgi:2-dehydro-3-deoxy-D-arabinonate dehydratase
MTLVRFYLPDRGARMGLRRDDSVIDLGDRVQSLTAWLRGSVGRVAEAVAELETHTSGAATIYPAADFDHTPSLDTAHWLPPVEDQDVWAAGVTYERSRAARQEEAVDGGDVYARVYSAERPELFFKARGTRVIGPLGAVGIRRDATWNVPEPELALVMNPALEVVGYTVGNDVSSRDIEGANPLYLPQAKLYTASCALGPGIVPGALTEWPAVNIRLSVERGGATVFDETIHTDRIHRTVADLLDYLGRSTAYPDGVVLLTGTGIVPPNNFTLAEGDRVRIHIDGAGTLENTVQIV